MARRLSRRVFVTASAATLTGTTAALAPSAAVAQNYSTSKGFSPDRIPALIEAQRAAVAEVEAAKAEVNRADEIYLTDGLMYSEWVDRTSQHPELQTTRNRLTAAYDAENAAYLALVEAARQLMPPGLVPLAQYACELTDQDEGPPVGDASYAYRMLAGLIGIPIFDGWAEDFKDKAA
jgi:hypothetical protein